MVHTPSLGQGWIELCQDLWVSSSSPHQRIHLCSFECKDIPLQVPFEIVDLDKWSQMGVDCIPFLLLFLMILFHYGIF